MSFLNEENNQKLAEFLRETRVEQNLTLDDISSKNGIPIQHLKKIEEGSFEEYDSFYLKMYLKKYASSLSLNIDELYQHFYGEELKKEPEVRVKKSISAKHNKQKVIHNIGKIIGVICAIVILVLGVMIASDMIRSGNNESLEGPEVVNPNIPDLDEDEDDEDDGDEDDEDEDGEDDQLGEAPIGNSEPETNIEQVSHEGINQIFAVETTANQLEIELTFTGECWIGTAAGTSVTLDSGNTLTENGGMYQAGDTELITFTESGSLTFNIGNVQLVSITVNGELVEISTATHQWITLNMTVETE